MRLRAAPSTEPRCPTCITGRCAAHSVKHFVGYPPEEPQKEPREDALLVVGCCDRMQRRWEWVLANLGRKALWCPWCGAWRGPGEEPPRRTK